MKKVISLTTLIAMSFLCSNCATLMMRTSGSGFSDHYEIYPATKLNVEAIGGGIDGPDDNFDLHRCAGPLDSVRGRLIFGIGALFDLPFSLTFDTIFLPFDLASKSEPSQTEVAE